MAKRICTVVDCDSAGPRRGLCGRHYRRLRLYGDPLGEPPPPSYPTACEGCGDTFTAQRMHSRWCSRYCRGVVNAREEKAARQAARLVSTCLWCGADISDLRSDARYCSNYCSNRVDWRENRERIEAAARQYREANPDKLLAAGRRYRHAKRAEIYARQARWQQENSERHKRYQQEYQRAYRAANADKVRLKAAARYAQKRSNGSGGLAVSDRDWHRMLLAYRNGCAYCGGEVKDLHLEHVIPLARGGRHAIGNLVPACPPCNFSKNDRLLVEWRYGRRRIRRRPSVE